MLTLALRQAGVLTMIFQTPQYSKLHFIGNKTLTKIHIVGLVTSHHSKWINQAYKLLPDRPLWLLQTIFCLANPFLRDPLKNPALTFSNKTFKDIQGTWDICQAVSDKSLYISIISIIFIHSYLMHVPDLVFNLQQILHISPYFDETYFWKRFVLSSRLHWKICLWIFPGKVLHVKCNLEIVKILRYQLH